jgi:cysteine-S-conjugate beta-lyase
MSSAAPLEHPFDAITEDELRAVGGKKWTAFPGATGAWIAEMDFGTAPAVVRALQEAVAGVGLGYLPAAHLAAAREAFAGFAADRYGWTVAPDDVHPVADVLTAMQAVVRLYSRPGSKVILPTPAYMPFLTLPGDLDRELIQVPMARETGPAGERHVYDLDALDAAFTAGGHMLVLCNPHNPIGRVLERSEMLAIAEVVDRHDGVVFSDEIHAPLVYAPHRHVPYASVSPQAAAHTVTAASASKAFNLPGLKAALLIVHDDAARATWRARGHVYTDQASTTGVIAAAAAFAQGREWLDDVVGYLDGNRRLLAELLADHLPGVGYVPPEGTYLAWLDVRALGLDHPAVFFRQHARVAATDGALCGDAGAGHVRFNLAMPRPVLRDAVTRMGAAVASRVG